MNHFIIRLYALILFLGFTFLSCSSGDDDIGNQLETDRIEDKAEYDIHIGGDGSAIRTLIGENLDGARWDPDIGYVWLSTDLNNEPIGTLTLTIVRDKDKGDGYANVTGAILSTSDVREGTAIEINGKLYTQVDASSNFIKIKEIGANFIYVDEFSIVLQEVNAEPSGVVIGGWFIAMDE